MDQLASADLSWEKRQNLLQRLPWPDVPNLPKLVADVLTAPHPQEFRAYPIQGKLTLAHLDELLKHRPALLTQPKFAQIWAAKLQPGADDGWRRDRAVIRAYLDRLQAFVGRLAPAFNSLKAHVLYQRLAFDRAEGVYDKARFLAYLRLLGRQRHCPVRRRPEERPKRAGQRGGRWRGRVRGRGGQETGWREERRVIAGRVDTRVHLDLDQHQIRFRFARERRVE